MKNPTWKAIFRLVKNISADIKTDVIMVMVMSLYSAFSIFKYSNALLQVSNVRTKTRPQHRELRALLFFDECVGSLTSSANHYSEDAGDGAYGLSSLS